MQAIGSFTVKLAPSRIPDQAEGGVIGQMSIDKRFEGDLDATGKGSMLTAVTGTKGSAGYVAIEHVTGTLGGRAGSFVLQHSGAMTRGIPELTITVVPDSGTGELAGLAGAMTILKVEGRHSYVLDYSVSEVTSKPET